MILVVTGLLREAAIAQGVVQGPGVPASGVMAVSGGGQSSLLVKRIKAAIRENAITGVLSFGVAGALSPGLAVGEAVVAATVREGERRFYTDPAWTARLSVRTGARPVNLAGEDAPAVTPAAKAALRAATGAGAVDMESHLAGRLAKAHGLPFAVLRVISDRAAHGLPPAATAGMRPDGGVDARAVMGRLLRDPRQLPALVRTGRDAGRAFKALAKARKAAGVDFGLPTEPLA